MNAACRCGREKPSWNAFCTVCYATLPDDLKPVFRERDAARIAAATAFLDAWDVEQARKLAEILSWGR